MADVRRKGSMLKIALAGSIAMSLGAQGAPAQAESMQKHEAERSAHRPGMMPHGAQLFAGRSLSGVPGFPLPSIHTQQAYDPAADFTSRWTRADALQIKAHSSTSVAVGQNSMPAQLTMPNIPADFPQTNPDVWIWDTWTLIDKHADQFSYNGWEVIFSLTADPNAGYTFDDRHVHARIGFFYRRAGIPASQRPVNGGWIYGGHLFPDGTSAQVFAGTTYTEQAEWSGSTRLVNVRGNTVSVFYTDLAFNRNPDASNITPPVAVITQTLGQIHADFRHVWFTGFGTHTPLLRPDGVYYQTGQQNEFYSFRDPFTFEDPQHPGVNYMVFEGNTAGDRGTPNCTEADLGYRPNDPHAETLQEVLDSGAYYQKANIGLAVAENGSLSKWKFLPPLISANCVNDQTERPQVYIKDGKYYIFTISHRTTYAAGVDGPDGVYGFVGNGIRSDFQPMNYGSGLVLGNPTDLNTAAGTDFDPNPDQNPRAFQSYSHYIMPGGLVESFIDTVEGRRGGALSPTVRVKIAKSASVVDLRYGNGGLGAYGDIPANRADINIAGFIQDLFGQGGQSGLLAQANGNGASPQTVQQINQFVNQ
ncbi:glycoside hydrolase family 68 protein [Gluconacetobacter johannae]|uniref:Glycoside hydrolase family 68 protein n=2 Tax=Gluconacetobacter johannae TaxID=112140 RepID=A0A7W4J7L1_9PROT|nr:glycoside hydrolase family 68 protein [Gluconacetobacter johannae]MBB2176167.1 glycoside hydrolase family 68 protein [Gluconacetobacter johannae]